MITGNCPACGARFSIREGIRISERLRCPECGVLLEYTGKGPFFVEWVEENWGLTEPDATPVGKVPLAKRTRPTEKTRSSLK